jgi:drug/metabolite transporter (DMT)-like permease
VPALLALLSALVWGVADFVGGLASRRSTPLQTLVLTTPAGLVLIVPLALLVHGDPSGTALPGIGSALFGSMGILLLYAALTIGPMGIVSPIAAVIGAAIPVVVGLLQGDRPGTAAYAGMVLAVVAIVTVGLEPRAPTDDANHQKVSTRALVLAILSGIGIGGFLAVISLAPDNSGLWSVVWARGTSTVIIAVLGGIVALRSRTPYFAVERPVRVQALSAGVLDVGANAIYVLALQIGLLSVVSVLGSLYPAATVLLARFVLAERLRPMQKVGMVTAIIAAALLALG